MNGELRWGKKVNGHPNNLSGALGLFDILADRASFTEFPEYDSTIFFLYEPQVRRPFSSLNHPIVARLCSIMPTQSTFPMISTIEKVNYDIRSDCEITLVCNKRRFIVLFHAVLFHALTSLIRWNHLFEKTRWRSGVERFS